MSNNHNIIIIEDDIEISTILKNHLEKEGYTVDLAHDGLEGLKKFKLKQYALVILDIMLPKVDGIEVLKKIREDSLIPVLILSAKDSFVDKSLGLELGADDYIAKPFSLLEMTSRVKAALRRSINYSAVEEKASKKSIGSIVIDFDNYCIWKDDQSIKLTAKEFAILELLVSYPNKVFTKAQIYQSVWHDTYYGDENVINAHIRRLRSKVEDDASKPKIVVTLWGIGYKLGENL